MNLRVNIYGALLTVLCVFNATMNARDPSEHLFWFMLALLFLILSVDTKPPLAGA